MDGPEVAQVMWAPQWTAEDIGGLPVLAGMASAADLAAVEAARKKRGRRRGSRPGG